MFELIGMTVDAEPNEYGNTVARLVLELPSSPYVYEGLYCTVEGGWVRYETTLDFKQYGVWVHLADREIMAYARGSLTLTTCPDDAQLKAQLDAMAKFYGPAPLGTERPSVEGIEH